jgi:hypothetical protein
MSGILSTGEVSILSRYMAAMTAAIASTAASLSIPSLSSACSSPALVPAFSTARPPR